MTRPTPAAPRRTPKQLRSRRTVERILAGAARVFVREGFESATTNRVAEEAGVSVGSLYQFFPNKAALVAALRAAHLARVRDVMGEALRPEPSRSLETIVDDVVRAFEALDAAEPGLMRVLLDARPDDGCAALHEIVDLEREIAAAVEALVARLAPGLTAARRARVAQMAVHLADALFVLPQARGGGFEREVVDEVRVALLAYLRAAVNAP